MYAINITKLKTKANLIETFILCTKYTQFLTPRITCFYFARRSWLFRMSIAE